MEQMMLHQFFCLQGAEEFAAGKVADFGQVGVRARDDHTLVLELKHPVPYLPTLIAQRARLNSTSAAL